MARKLSAVFFFIVAIISGMQLARIQISVLGSAVAQTAAPAASVPASTSAAAATAAADTGLEEQMINQMKSQMTGGAGAVVSPSSLGPVPASTMMQNTPAPKPADEKFVPSEVSPVFAATKKVPDPRAIIHTTMGKITIRLAANLTPRSVRHFIELARGDREFVDVRTSKKTRRPFYSNMIFHKIVAGYFIQTGCPFGTGRGGPGYAIADEYHPNLRFNKPGMVAFAPVSDGTKTQADSNGSQFFITLNAMPEFNDKFTIFGEVEKGMDVVKKIAAAKVGPTDRPIRRIYLQDIEVVDELTAKAAVHGPASVPSTGSPMAPPQGMAPPAGMAPIQPGGMMMPSGQNP